ncbi:MAG: TolC family protein [Myxococcota bacterium]
MNRASRRAARLAVAVLTLAPPADLWAQDDTPPSRPPVPSPDAPGPGAPTPEAPPSTAPPPPGGSSSAAVVDGAAEAPPRDVVPADDPAPDAVGVGAAPMRVLIDPPRPRDGRSLSLGRVLQSMEGVHPKLEEAEAKVDAAEGKLLGKRGGFDPKAKLSVKGQPLGFYDKGDMDAFVTQETPLWGASFYAGYGRSFGNWPGYDAGPITLNGGEFRAGVDLPIWRGGPIDRRRADISQAEFGVSEAERDRDMTELLLDNAAAYAYWSWVEAGLVLEIHEALLAVAEARNDGLNRRIEAGDAPDIDGIDNQRAIFDRQTKVIDARRKLETASIKLSLYYRDREGRPDRPDRAALPRGIPEPTAPNGDRLDDDIQLATKKRGDVRALEAAVAQARVEAELRDNQVSPQVNVMAWAAQDIGNRSLQDKDDTVTGNLRPFELGVGVTLEMPLLLRKDRGNAAEARGKLGAARAKVRWQREVAEADVRQAFANLEAAYETVSLARDTRKAAEALAVAERRKLALGATDILYVNLRELYAAEAATKEVKALADYQRARADYLTAAARGIR